MRFYKPQADAHQVYCGALLHARTICLCVFDHARKSASWIGRRGKRAHFWDAILCNRPGRHPPLPLRERVGVRAAKSAVVDLETDRGLSPQRCLAQSVVPRITRP